MNCVVSCACQLGRSSGYCSRRVRRAATVQHPRSGYGGVVSEVDQRSPPALQKSALIPVGAGHVYQPAYAQSQRNASERRLRAGHMYYSPGFHIPGIRVSTIAVAGSNVVTYTKEMLNPVNRLAHDGLQPGLIYHQHI